MEIQERVNLLLDMLHEEYPSNIFELRFERLGTKVQHFGLYVFGERKQEVQLSIDDGIQKHKERLRRYKDWVTDRSILNYLVII